ncbi:hypothetical protein TNCV_1588001 [Trichonephila clavipes]|uniref:Uncharacterized protein n=1 Tax=Trichonephila clavipes TaxID=2585209 RepID=A0A8X6REN4_TRICX|nr:hypothetical protein TNCV_1588001 [Trichonephila clavipes]
MYREFEKIELLTITPGRGLDITYSVTEIVDGSQRIILLAEISQTVRNIPFAMSRMAAGTVPRMHDVVWRE